MIEDHDIDLVTDEIHIVKGIDKDGDSCYATKFAKAGTEKSDGSCHLIDFLDGLGMLEAAKADFIDRHQKIGFNDE